MSKDGSSSSGVSSLDAVTFMAQIKSMQDTMDSLHTALASVKEDVNQQLKLSSDTVNASIASVQEDMSLKLSSLEERVKGKSATILKWNLFILKKYFHDNNFYYLL